MQVLGASAAAVRVKLLAREISVLERELDTKAVVYVMGRAHVHMRTDTNWYSLSTIDHAYACHDCLAQAWAVTLMLMSSQEM